MWKDCRAWRPSWLTSSPSSFLSRFCWSGRALDSRMAPCDSCVVDGGACPPTCLPGRFRAAAPGPPLFPHSCVLPVFRSLEVLRDIVLCRSRQCPSQKIAKSVFWTWCTRDESMIPGAAHCRVWSSFTAMRYRYDLHILGELLGEVLQACLGKLGLSCMSACVLQWPSSAVLFCFCRDCDASACGGCTGTNFPGHGLYHLQPLRPSVPVGARGCVGQLILSCVGGEWSRTALGRASGTARCSNGVRWLWVGLFLVLVSRCLQRARAVKDPVCLAVSLFG